MLVNQSATAGVAGTADELMYLLASPAINRIVLGGEWAVWGERMEMEGRWSQRWG